MKIAFSTLGCPEWSFDRIIEEAQRLGYDGIELRCVENELFLPEARPFLPENFDTTMFKLKEHGIEICVLDTSCSFHDPQKFDTSIKEGMSTIDLAEKMKVPFIRVFGNEVPEPAKKDETIDLVVRGITQLCDYCEGKNVSVLLETHGDFSELENLMPVLEAVESPHFGLLWDVEHTYTQYGEDNTGFFNRTKNYIRHIHIKDTKKNENGYELCLTGKGDVPIKKDLELLKSAGYGGYLSFEWEKKWHPGLEAPEVAIPGFIEYILMLMSTKIN